MTMTKHEKKIQPLSPEQKAQAWAAFCQLMHVVSRPDYPPKPKKEEEGDHDDHDVRPD